MRKTKTITTVNQQVKYTHDNGKYVCSESRTNGEVVNQEFLTADTTKSHPYAYENKSLWFRYYPDLTPFDRKDINSDKWYRELEGNAATIVDPASFKSFDHCLAIWLSMDGEIYQLTSPYPLSIWKSVCYIDSRITNLHYDLDKVVKRLNSIKWVEDVAIHPIPYYNSECGRAYVGFNYRLPDKVIRRLVKANSGRNWQREIFQPESGFDIFGLKSCRNSRG